MVLELWRWKNRDDSYRCHTKASRILTTFKITLICISRCKRGLSLKEVESRLCPFSILAELFSIAKCKNKQLGIQYLVYQTRLLVWWATVFVEKV